MKGRREYDERDTTECAAICLRDTTGAKGDITYDFYCDILLPRIREKRSWHFCIWECERQSFWRHYYR